jgi:DNA polymerase III delta subunit
MAKPVYALVGEDSFRQLAELGRILADLPADAQRSDYDGETAELAEVLDDLRSFAMFGGGKVVVVRSADEFVSRYREPLENYLAHPSNSGSLVLRLNSLPKVQRVYKLIAKVGEVVECTPPRAQEEGHEGRGDGGGIAGVVASVAHKVLRHTSVYAPRGWA